jgi:very-short-patch-repair endonuclease
MVIRKTDAPLEVVLRNLADKAAMLNQIRKCESFGEIMIAVALWRSRDRWTVEAQYPISGYRVDLVIPEAKLCVEVDGAVAHGTPTQHARDVQRQSEIEAQGWAFVRVSAADAFLHAGECSVAIVEAIGNIIARPVPKTPAEELADKIEQAEHAIRGHEAALALVDVANLAGREPNEERLKMLRAQLAGLKDQEALRTASTVEEESAILRRVQERARARHAAARKAAA